VEPEANDLPASDLWGETWMSGSVPTVVESNDRSSPTEVRDGGLILPNADSAGEWATEPLFLLRSEGMLP